MLDFLSHVLSKLLVSIITGTEQIETFATSIKKKAVKFCIQQVTITQTKNVTLLSKQTSHEEATSNKRHFHRERESWAAMSADYGTRVDMDGDMEEDKYSHAGRPHRCCVRYGNTWVVCSLSEKFGMFPATLHVGPNWPCMLVTYCLALGPLFLFFMYVIYKPWIFILLSRACM